MLDLNFIGAPIADDGGFDGERGVFGDSETRARRCQHGNAADVAQLESGLYVDGKEYIFDCDFFWLLAFDDGLETAENFVQAIGDCSAGSRVNRADGYAVQFAEAIEFDDAVAGVFGAAIDA